MASIQSVILKLQTTEFPAGVNGLLVCMCVATEGAMMSCKVMLTLNVSILNGEVGEIGISGDRVCQTYRGGWSSRQFLCDLPAVPSTALVVLAECLERNQRGGGGGGGEVGDC